VILTAVTMKTVVFWDIKPQFVPHRRHYFSATENSRLILCKISDFHGGDYEMPFFGMWHRVSVRTDASQGRVAYFIRMKRISKLRTALAAQEPQCATFQKTALFMKSISPPLCRIGGHETIFSRKTVSTFRTNKLSPSSR
jgi:hypothetical protein